MRTILCTITIALLLGACAQEDSNADARLAGAAEEGIWNVERKRAWAAKLRAEGLEEQAIVVYEDLLDDGRGLSENAFVGASLIVAEIHVERGRHAQALASLHRAMAFEPKGEVGNKIERLMIRCLERLGRSAAADRLLDRAAAPEGGAAAIDDPNDLVVARIGKEEVRRSELETLLAGQPAELQSRMSDPKMKLEVLKSLVAQRVMERKARKLGLQDDPQVRLAAELAERDVLVRKLVADEVRKRVDVKPEDARLYHQAHPEIFREPSTYKLAHILADDLKHEERIRAALAIADFEKVVKEESRDRKSVEQGGLLEGEVLIGKSHPVLGDTRRLVEVLGDAKAGEVAAKSLKTTRGRHVLKVIERRDGAPIPFEKVQQEAMRMLRAEREQAALQEMMAAALKESDVEILEDALK